MKTSAGAVRRTLLLAGSLMAVLPRVTLAQRAVEDPHGELREECSTCHGAEGWTPARIDPGFDHAKTGFALDHAHAGLACRDCHATLRFGDADPWCASCHVDVHGGELGADCALCHRASSFLDLSPQRARHRTTRFALTGAHAGADCESCHPPTPSGGLQYLGTSTECIDCHADAYAATTDPDHVAGNFLQRCDSCHGTATWAGGFFNHERQLVGSSAVCVDCHRSDYDGAVDPPHSSGGFPLQCESCHGTRSWQGAFFQHDDRWFPIYGGRHASEWDACSDCHKVAGDFLQFDCLGCHPHSDRQETDGHHRDEDEYVYASTACYRCHPRGRSE